MLTMFRSRKVAAGSDCEGQQRRCRAASVFFDCHLSFLFWLQGSAGRPIQVTRVAAAYGTSSISSSRHVLSNHGCIGP
jgi:hypothetical protein